MIVYLLTRTRHRIWGLQNVREVEINDMVWQPHMKAAINSANAPLHPSGDYMGLLGFILRFTGLKHLCLTYNVGLDKFIGKSPQQCFEKMLDCRLTMHAFVERHKHLYVDGTAPIVRVRHWIEEDWESCWVTPDGIFADYAERMNFAWTTTK